MVKQVQLLALAIALTLPALAFGAPKGDAAYALAQQPQCYVSDGIVIVRGAVAFIESHEPAPGMVVALKYGDLRARATSGEHGTYIATFPREQAGAEIREVATYATVTGSLAPVTKVQSFAAACFPANVRMGALKKME